MTASIGRLVAVRLTHEAASVDDLAGVRPDDEQTTVSSLLDEPGVSEALVLTTCNRVEAYVVAGGTEAGHAALGELAVADHETATAATGDDAVEHLLRVAAGLESMVLGEDEILGQVQDAYEAARDADAVGPVLEVVGSKAIRLGKRVRTETAIGEHASSVAEAAVEYLATRTDLAGSTALVIGAGRMGRTAARAFADAGAGRLVVANRTLDRAEAVREELSIPARTVSLEELPAALADADVAVTATGSDEPVLDAERVSAAGDGDAPARTVVADVAQPRDVAPAARSCPWLTVADLDDLSTVTGVDGERHRKALAEVQRYVADAVADVRAERRRRRVDDVVAEMYADAERIKERELDAALSKLTASGTLTDDQREVVESLADALVSRLLADPTAELRRAASDGDWERVRQLAELFSDTDAVPEDDGSATVDWTADFAAPSRLRND